MWPRLTTLEALGVHVDGAPQKLYVNYLDDITTAATPVGTLFEPDYEALVKLSPDVIFSGGRSSPLTNNLNKIAPTLDMTIWGDNHIDQSLSRLDTLAKITGTQDKGDVLKTALIAKLEATKTTVDGKGNALILLTNGGKISAYGRGSRFGWLHSALNLPEAVANVDAQTHGEAISFEFIAQSNPDWIFVIDRSAAIGAEAESAASTLDNGLVAGTTAAQKDQILYLNAANLYISGGGIQSINATLDEVLAAFKRGEN